MATHISRHQTRAMGLFWGLMGLCGVLTVACIRLALGELGQPWSGFSLNTFGSIQDNHGTEFVYFDQVLGVNGQRVRGGADVRDILQRLPLGSPVTYRILRGQQTLEVTVPVQATTWKRLLVECGILLLAALVQLCLGAVVFLLRPNTPRSWVFLGFCLTWFGLIVTLFDLFSTYVFTHLFFFCWFLTSALFLHLALVFPEEWQSVRRYPRLPYLLYLPSLVIWGIDELCFYGVLPTLSNPLTRRNLINLTDPFSKQAKDLDFHLMQTFDQVVYLTLDRHTDAGNPFE